ncbi:MAG: hypothetical protein JNK45_28305, partial [Myxococcales bacterium]|nr:hypothetical protein [Myxococcales bacterium]
MTWRVEPGAPPQLLVTFAVDPARPAARGDAAVLARLHHQVHAPPGIRWILHTSLLSDGDDAGLVTLARSDAELLEGWLFGESTSVHAYLHERVRAPHVSPPPPVTIAVALPEDARNRRTLYPVTVQLELRRAGPAPEGVEDAPGLHSAITSIPPSSDPTLAATFEVALSTPEALLRLAHELGSPTAGAQLHAQWAVQIGRAGIATPIAFAVHPSPPTVFAPAPFSTRLLRLGPVPIRDHTTGVGRGLEPTRHVEFAAIDMDAWLAALFAGVDRALAPEFAASIQTLSERDRREPQGVDHLARIVAAKHRIAEVASAWMLPVRADSDADPTAVRELFRRRLCSRLSNAQATWAAVEFDAAVHAGVVEASLGPSARLFGKIVEHAADGGPPRDTTITWAELALADADHAPLPFLLDALGARRTSAAASVPLELVYAATQIEHGAPGHGALAFVIPSTDGPWTQRLGAVEVPVVLREAPASPVLIQQTAVGAAPDGSVSALARWDCMFTYAMPGQPAQDRLYVAIAFDVGPSATIREADTDRLHPIAEFLTVVPSIHADFVALLPRLGRETQDEALVRSARLAVESFTDLLASAADALVREPSAALGRDASPIDAALSGAVSIHEDEVELPDPTAPGRTIRALRITLAGPSPIGTARVDIDAQRYEPMVHAVIEGERVSYVYVDRRSNALLTAEEARHIETRTFVLPDLDLVSRPCARATVSRTRNEALPDGTPIATPFVYRTPAVSFADPLCPLVDRRDPVDLTATEASPDGDASIAGHLQRFFDALFAAARSEGARRTVSIEVSYEHRIAEATAAARLMIEL